MIQKTSCTDEIWTLVETFRFAPDKNAFVFVFVRLSFIMCSFYCAMDHIRVQKKVLCICLHPWHGNSRARYCFTCHLCCLMVQDEKQVALCVPQPARCHAHLPRSLTSLQSPALSELMMGTAGCEHQPGACDCRWKTAYWSTLTADRNHHRQTVLIRLKIAMIFSSDRTLFFFIIYTFPACILITKHHLWHTTCMRYDSEWQYSESHIVRHPAPWEWDLSEHVWLTLSSTMHWHQFVSAVG